MNMRIIIIRQWEVTDIRHILIEEWWRGQINAVWCHNHCTSYKKLPLNIHDSSFTLLACQFHQHFTRIFYIQMWFAQLLCAYKMGLLLFGKRKSAQKLLIKCWWNWLLVLTLLRCWCARRYNNTSKKTWEKEQFGETEREGWVREGGVSSVFFNLCSI